MEQPNICGSLDQEMEGLAAKSLYAAAILKNVANIAQDLQKLQKKVNRYVQQVAVVVTWKNGCGILKMVGSASKTVGGVLVMAAPFHPKLGAVFRVGQKLWKLGTGLKAFAAVGHILKDLWQAGCRNSLLEFVSACSLLTQNMGVFREVIQDLKKNIMSHSLGNSRGAATPETIINILRQFIPSDQINYVAHVIHIAFGDTRYSPLFDLITMSLDVSNSSNILQLMREIESLNFIEFASQDSGHYLIAIGSFLHITRELLDFLDSFQKVTQQDCKFLLDCLTKFVQESANIMKAASVLNSLSQLTRQQEDVTQKTVGKS